MWSPLDSCSPVKTFSSTSLFIQNVSNSMDLMTQLMFSRSNLLFSASTSWQHKQSISLFSILHSPHLHHSRFPTLLLFSRLVFHPESFSYSSSTSLDGLLMLETSFSGSNIWSKAFHHVCNLFNIFFKTSSRSESASLPLPSP